MTVYELNKSAMSAKPDMDADAIASKETMITDFFNNTDNDFYMLLCRERNDYTLFYNELYENSIEQLIEEMWYLFDNRGKLKEIQFDETGKAIEFWVSIDGEPHCYFFFPYDEGVIRH